MGKNHEAVARTFSVAGQEAEVIVSHLLSGSSSCVRLGPGTGLVMDLVHALLDGRKVKGVVYEMVVHELPRGVWINAGM